MNWENVNLESPYECSQDILDGYSFETLLLEILCNLPTIDAETVEAQFEISLQSKIESAREIFKLNSKNILKHALKERAKP